MLLEVLGARAGDLEGVLALGELAGQAQPLGGLAGLCFFGAVMIIMPVVMILIGMPMQIAVLRAELTDDVNAAMKFKEKRDMCN